MTALRQRLIEDMQLRNFSRHTIEAYVRAVAFLAKRYRRSPDKIAGEQVRQYLLYMVKERQVSWSLYNQTRCALQFFYRVTLDRDEWFHKLPCAKRPKLLPGVLSADELRRLFAAAAHQHKHKALLMTLYGTGLRISEAFALKPADIDSKRMLIHVRAGKGNKGRMVPLSVQLLAVLRDYNSCRNRHCPKCQASACAQWMEDRAAELLPVEYFHVVFTLPDTFNGLALANKRVVYGALFEAVSRTLLEVAADPRHLEARIGFIGILHTWGQNLGLHPHVHCIVPGGGLSPDGSRWIGCKPGFFLPVRVLSKVFRGKFIDLLKTARQQGKLVGMESNESFNRLLNASVKRDWVVYAKRPFGGPEQVLKYLSRYTHRIAISNSRLTALDNQTVSFRWKDYAHGNQPRTIPNHRHGPRCNAAMGLAK